MLYYFIMSPPKITFLTTFLMVSFALQDLGAQINDIFYRDGIANRKS